MTERRTGISAYPLSWPSGWQRCQTPEFSRFDTSLTKARDSAIREIELLGASQIVVSSNAVLLVSGLIAARQPRIDDTGVAAYFVLYGEQKVLPCDRWIALAENMQAIAKTVNAMRGIERWGAKEIISAMFRGFEALPDGLRSWWDVLGLPSSADRAMIDAAYRSLAKVRHPDVGGSLDEFAELSEAYRQATSGGR